MGGPALFSDGIWRLFKPDYPTGAEKCRCLVLLNGRGALPTLLAMLLIQIRVQGGGEAKLPSFLTYRLILIILAMNRENKSVYTEAQPSQLKSQKIPSDTVPADPTLRCPGVRHTNERKRTKRKYMKLHQVGGRNVSFGTDVW
jgi:hypothetical protein